MLKAVDHQLRKDDHAGPPHPGAAVDDDQIYATHDVTPSAVAIAERILIVV
jgi:hypothetical protein